MGSACLPGHGSRRSGEGFVLGKNGVEEAHFHAGIRLHSAVAVAPRSVHWQRLRCADIRDRLVPASGTGHWRVGHFAGCAARNVHGRDVSGQLPISAMDIRTPASATNLQPVGVGHRNLRTLDFLRHALCRRLVWRHRRVWFLGNRASGCDLFRLFDAANTLDGSDASRHCAMGSDNAQRNLLARIFLWREYRWSRAGFRAGRILSLAALRHGGRDVCCRGDQRFRRASRFSYREVVAILTRRRGFEAIDFGRARFVAGLCCDRSFGIGCSGCGSGLDAAAVDAVWCIGLRVLDYSRRVPGVPGHWQQPGLGHVALEYEPAAGSRYLSGAPDRGHRMVGVHDQ